MSYALDAGRAEHLPEQLAGTLLSYTCLTHKEIVGTGRAAVTFDRVPVARATEFAGEEADIGLRLWLVLKPRLIAEHVDHRLRDLGAADRAGLGADGADRHQGRAGDARQPLRQLRPEPRQARGRDQGACRRGFQYRLAEAARRDPVRQDEPARRAAHQDRRLEHGRERARGACRRGPRSAAQSPRLAPARQAEEHLYRRAAHLHPSRDRARAHLLRARRHHHRAALVARAEFAEHPGAHQRRPRHPQGLRVRQGQAADLAPTTARSSFACSRTWPTRRRCARPSPTGSTSTP